MCESKLHGRMGFRNLRAFNLAMLGKQAWRILTNLDSLIARIYKAKFFPSSNILSAKISSNPSYAWRSIHSSLEVIRKGTRWASRQWQIDSHLRRQMAPNPHNI